MGRSMNKSQLSESLFQHFKDRPGMSKAFAAEIVGALFSVAPRYTSMDARDSNHKNARCSESDVGTKVNADQDDGILANHLLQGGRSKVTIPGFGTLSVVFRKERVCRHPESGDMFSIPATHVITFRAGKALKIAAANDL